MIVDLEKLELLSGNHGSRQYRALLNKAPAVRFRD